MPGGRGHGAGRLAVPIKRFRHHRDISALKGDAGQDFPIFEAELWAFDQLAEPLKHIAAEETVRIPERVRGNTGGDGTAQEQPARQRQMIAKGGFFLSEKITEAR